MQVQYYNEPVTGVYFQPLMPMWDGVSFGAMVAPHLITNTMAFVYMYNILSVWKWAEALHILANLALGSSFLGMDW